MVIFYTDDLALFSILLFFIMFIRKMFAFGGNNRTPLKHCLTPPGSIIDFTVEYIEYIDDIENIEYIANIECIECIENIEYIENRKHRKRGSS